MSELYDNENQIPTADHDEPEPASEDGTAYLSWIGFSFIAYVLGGGAAGALGVSTIYIAVAPVLLGVTFAALVALDARQLDDWGPSKYLWAVASFFPPLVLAYYFRRGMVTA